jgi:hypothetical protein
MSECEELAATMANHIKIVEHTKFQGKGDYQ